MYDPTKQLGSEQLDDTPQPFNLLRIASVVLTGIAVILALIAVTCRG